MGCMVCGLLGGMFGGHCGCDHIAIGGVQQSAAAMGQQQWVREQMIGAAQMNDASIAQRNAINAIGMRQSTVTYFPPDTYEVRPSRVAPSFRDWLCSVLPAWLWWLARLFR